MSLSPSQSAAARAARRELGITAHRQRRAFGARFGGDAEQAFDFYGVTLRAFDRIAVENKLFEGVLAARAGVFVEGHRIAPCGHLRLRLIRSLACSRIFRSCSV